MNASYSTFIPSLSPELKLNLERAKKLYREGLEIYKHGYIELGAEKFKESNQYLKKIYVKYPNNNEINFFLLECCQAFDYAQAIFYAYKCVEIVENLIENDLINAQDWMALFYCRFDTLRKLYKLLIKENRLDEARKVLGYFISNANLVLEGNLSGCTSENTRIKLLNLIRENLIAAFFLKGIIEGRDMKRNLVVDFLVVDDSPELTYSFRREFGLADVKIMGELKELYF